MKCAIHHMTIIQYYRDDRPWTSEDIISPAWDQVEKAVRQMDDYCFPILEFNATEFEDCEEQLCVVGGNGRWAIFHFMGDWWYERANGSDEEVRLWQSDQGVFCKEKNLVYRADDVLDVVKVFYESASYDHLINEVNERQG